MELRVGDYGKIIFEMMVGANTGYVSDRLPQHWESIRVEAEPLVRQLIALNDKMSNGGYAIVGYSTADTKKKVLSRQERIEQTQDKLWLVEASTLQEGDSIFYSEEEGSFVDDGCGPWKVEDVTQKGVYIEVQHCGGRHTARIRKDEKVYKAPADYHENSHKYSEVWWLEQADRLGI